MKSAHNFLTFFSALSVGIIAATSFVASAADTNDAGASKFKDPEDGAFDVSEYLSTATGFLPVVKPITEPAVGYGAALALMFVSRVDSQGEAGFARPNITVVGGMLTENGTDGLMVADIRHWMNDRLKTISVIGDADLNLEFYGIGSRPELEGVPLGYTWSPRGGMFGANYRVTPESNWWVGLQYSYAKTRINFDLPVEIPPEFVPDTSTLANAALAPSVTFDSRDTIFTPSSGNYVSFAVNFYDEAFGSDRDFQTATLTAIHYQPISDAFTLGLKGDLLGSFGPVPFYLKPSVNLRGVPAMSHQGQHVAQAEAELRWEFTPRYSLVGFTGIANAWNEGNDRSRGTVVSGGFGFRYELARLYGLHAGLDLAFGPDDPAIYITVGSAWMRP